MTERPSGPRRFAFSTPFEELLAGAHAGEGWAYDELFTALRQPITAFVVARGVRDPNDVVNEVFLGAFRTIDRFSGGPHDFRAWIFRIARNKVADHFRQTFRQPSLISITEATETAGGDAEAEALSSLGLGELSAVLEQLTDEQREVVVLRMVSDLSLEQVAEIVSKPVGAVKQLQRRALVRIRKEISDEGVSR